MRILIAILATAVVAALCVVPRGWAQGLPDLGDVSGGSLPPNVERRIGESIMRDIRFREPSYVDDPELADYLNTLGQRLLAASPGARQDFEFFAIRDSSVNAFALPGGFIGVHTGLLVASESESELASVLAHEIAHVTQRHIARLIGRQQQLNLPMMIAVAAAILAARSRPDLAVGAATAAQAGAVQSQLNYTRDFEREADRLGFATLAGAGFDVHAMATFFEKMQRYGRVNDDGSVPGYLRTHPITTERIADVQGRAAATPYRQVPDSLEFHLLRAKLRAEQGDARDAVTHFSTSVRDGRYANEAAARYGLVSALLRAKEPAAAQAAMAQLRAAGAPSPMIELLDARVKQAAGDHAAALALLRQAIAKFPYRRPLVYAQVDALLSAGGNDEALAVIAEQLRLHPRDASLFELQAKTHAALGKRLLQHLALAEVYKLRGSLLAAIEQLQLARTAGDGNFYELSVIDARLRDLRTLHAQEIKDTRR